jgi:hypothetical protein
VSTQPLSAREIEDYKLAATCMLCKTMHASPLARWRCSGCDQILCLSFAMDGRQVARKGQKVHLARHREDGKVPTVRLCGILTRVEDCSEDIIVPPKPVAEPPAEA